MTFLKSILLAFSMFSATPVPRVEWNEKNMCYMMAAFPLVGALITLLCIIFFIFVIQCAYFWQKPIPLPLLALVFTLIPVLVTGGIHVDGFMDTCDALASHAPREKKLEILKDSHSGAFAVLSCVLYFLSYFVLSYELCDYFFGADSNHRFVNESTTRIQIVMVNLFQHLSVGILKQVQNDTFKILDFLPVTSIFILSRLLSAFAVATFPIAKNSGLVHTFASASAKKFTALWCGIWLILISAALVLLFDAPGIFLVIPSLAVFIWYYFMTKRNFGGITGDTAGWFVQVCEIVSLGAFVIFLFTK